MPQYRVHYIAGPNENLTISRHQIIEAASFQEAWAGLPNGRWWKPTITLRPAPKIPATSLYDFEAWEAMPLEENKA